MKRCLLAVSFLFLASAIPLHANSITDPHIGILDPPNCDTGTTEFGTFTFSSNSTGGGFACFVNGTADSPTITSVDIETFGNFATDNCSADSTIVGFSNVFNNCSVTYFAAANVTDITFFVSDPIGPGGLFEVDLSNSQSCGTFNLNLSGTCTDPNPNVGSWTPNEFFKAETNLSQPQLFLTPEPSSIFLLGTGMLGLGLLALKRKRFGDFDTSV